MRRVRTRLRQQKHEYFIHYLAQLSCSTGILPLKRQTSPGFIRIDTGFVHLERHVQQLINPLTHYPVHLSNDIRVDVSPSFNENDLQRQLYVQKGFVL